jgi:hypothetical protein
VKGAKAVAAFWDELAGRGVPAENHA